MHMYKHAAVLTSMCIHAHAHTHTHARMHVRPAQYYLGWKIATFKLETVEVSDARVQRMHEILLAIKLVKFYVWERSFSSQVDEVRWLILRAALPLASPARWLGPTGPL